MFSNHTIRLKPTHHTFFVYAKSNAFVDAFVFINGRFNQNGYLFFLLKLKQGITQFEDCSVSACRFPNSQVTAMNEIFPLRMKTLNFFLSSPNAQNTQRPYSENNKSKFNDK